LAVGSGGIASAAIVDEGTLFIGAGGSAVSAKIAGGEEYVYGTDTGGTVSGTLQFAASQNVETGGVAISATISQGVQYVQGIASATNIDGNGYQQVLSGATVSATNVNSGGIEYVFSGGTARGTIVNSGGTLELFGSGSALGTTLHVGATLEAGAGTTFNSYVVSSGYTLAVGSGGILSGTQVQSGGTLEIFGGATEVGRTISAGGILEVGSGYTLSNYVVSSGFALEVASSGTISNVTVLSGGSLIVLSGGSSLSAGIATGVTVTVLSGGTMDATVLQSGATLDDYGATADTTISGGYSSDSQGNHTFYDGTELVESGATTTDTQVRFEGLQIVSAGGTASSTRVQSAGEQDVYGSAVDTFVNVQGLQVVSSGGRDSSSTIFGGQVVSSGGSAINTTIHEGYQIIESGGVVSGATVSFGTQYIELGATGIDTTLTNGGTTSVYGIASGTTLGYGAEQDVARGGTASGTIVTSVGIEVVQGVAFGTTVNLGGTQNVASGGTASNTVINTGGSQFVYGSGASAVGTTIGYNATQEIDAGGTAITTTISSGGTQLISGGTASASHVEFGAIQSIDNGGTAIGTTIDAGGEQDVGVGAAIGTTITGGNQFVGGQFIFYSGIQTVEDGGSATSTTVYQGGEQDVYGTASNTTVSGGVQHVYGAVSGVTLSGITSNGAVFIAEEDVYGGATASGVVLDNSGTQFDYGSAVGTTINSGGFQVVFSGGVATSTTISNGGQQNVAGVANNTTVESGGNQSVFSGGIASGTVLDGGEQVVLANGLAIGTVIASGGDAQILGGTGSSTVVGSGAVLDIGQAGARAVATTIKDGGKVYVQPGGTASSTTIESGGVQTVDYGGVSLGTTVQTGGLEYVSSGGFGDPSGVASGTILSGGKQDVYGVAVGTVIDKGGLEVIEAGATISGATINSGTLQLENQDPTGTGAITFVGVGGTLQIDGTAPVTVISGFSSGDTIDIVGEKFDSAGTAALLSGNLLQIVENGATYDLQFDKSQNLPTDYFTIASDASGGTLVTAIKTWQGGGGDNNWTTSSNWSGGAVPVATDHVFVGSAQNISLFGQQNAYSLDVTNPNATLSFDGGTLTLSGALHTSGLIRLVSGTNSIIAPLGVTIDSGGEVFGGTGTITGNVENDSVGYLGGGGVEAGYLHITGSLTGSGLASVSGEGELELGGPSSGNVQFSTQGYGGILKLDNPVYTGTITGVTSGNAFGSSFHSNSFVPVADTIDLGSVAFSNVANVTYSGNTLTVYQINGPTLTYNVQDSSAGTLSSSQLVWSKDNQVGGGTDIQWQVGSTRTWTEGVNGDWSAAADWTPNAVPGGYDTAVLGGTASYTVIVGKTDQATANVLDWSDPSATLVVSGTLTLNDTPQLSGGTMQIQGGTVVLTAASLDNATIDISDGSIISLQGYQPSYVGFNSNPTSYLNLGPLLTLIQTAGTSNIVSLDAGNGFSNQGKIEAGVAGGQFQIGVSEQYSFNNPNLLTFGYFSNSGVIEITNGDSLNGGGANFDNQSSGIITLGDGSSASFGSQYWSNEGSIAVGKNATLTLDGNYATAAYDNIINNGGTIILDGTPTDTGPITVVGGTLVLDPTYVVPSNNSSIFNSGGVISGGSLYIDGGATLELRGDASNGYVTSDSVNFNGAGATLVIDAPGDFVGQINGLASGDVIDLGSATFDSGAYATIGIGNELQLVVGGQTYDLNLDAAQVFVGEGFEVSKDANGGTAFTLVNQDITTSETVLSGQSVSNIVVASGGQLDVELGATAQNITLSTGGTENVYGTDINTTIYDGGVQNVMSGGMASGTMVLDPGLQVVSSGGTAISAIVSAGEQDVFGSTIATQVEDGGTQYVYGGGIASASIVEGTAAGGAQFVSSGGIAIDTDVTGTGAQYIYGGGTVSGTTLNGGSEYVFSGGSAGTTDIGSGGLQDVIFGGSASATTVESNGLQAVEAGGSATGTILNGGELDTYGSAVNTIISGGTLQVFAGGSANGTVVNGGGLLDVQFGGILDGGATLSGGTLVLSDGAIVSGSLSFAGSGGTLQIGGTTMPGSTISGLAPGDTIDLTNVGFSSAGSAVLASGNILHITENGHVYGFDLDPSQNLSNDVFKLSSDGHGGTALSVTTVPCYCRGTLILTDQGEVPVEELDIGDRVTTMSGARRPIKWVGRRSYSGRFALGQTQILPIRIGASAIAENVPRRDLWISPHHAMYLEGVLIEAKDLLNGITIVQAERVEKVEYFHIELDSHDVIIAEGAFSESFIDDDSRGMFHNAPEYGALYPDAVCEPARYCAPRCADGYEVDLVRQRLAARAGLRSQNDGPRIGMLRGNVDLVSANCIAGWAQNVEHPEAPVCLDIYADGRLVGQTLANSYRRDLEQAGLGSGKHSFSFVLTTEPSIGTALIEVRRSLDGSIVPSSQYEPGVENRSRSQDGRPRQSPVSNR